VTNIQRRLKKLEALVTDTTGLVPHSPAWVAYWSERFDKLDSDQDPGLRCIFPLAFIDHIFAESPQNVDPVATAAETGMAARRVVVRASNDSIEI